MTQRYTEEESRAIIEAELAGEPHPFPEKEARRTGRSDGALSADRRGLQETATIYQIAHWQDDKRAIPHDFVACALFAGIQGKDAAYVEQEAIASANGLTITFTGRRLTQVHADVWEGIMHLARQFPEGSVVRFKARQLLRLIGRHTGKRQRDELKLWLDQLTATSVVIHDERNQQRFRGSLLPRSAERDEDGDIVFAVEIGRDLAKMLSSGFSLVDWEQRQRLQKKPLALWLQHYFSRFPKPVTVAELHRLSGSTSRTLFHFRAQLRAALADLQDEGVIGGWRIDDKTDAVHLSRADKLTARASVPPSASQAAEQRELPLHGPATTEVSDRAKDTFRRLYPSRDGAQCLAAFGAWVHGKKIEPKNPDALFLDFAKKWASSGR